jgi:hypothetical protein
MPFPVANTPAVTHLDNTIMHLMYAYLCFYRKIIKVNILCVVARGFL